MPEEVSPPLGDRSADVFGPDEASNRSAARTTWVPRERAVDALLQTDAGLCADLARALPDTIAE